MGALVIASLAFLLSGEPYYRGRPVSDWATDYSQKLYPSGTAPLSPSQKGIDALCEMGPQKAATALVHALMRGDSKLYEQYRSFHAKLPAWYRNRFPLGLTHQQKVTLVLGAIEFLDPDYQKAMVPFLVAYLEKPQVRRQVAACGLLANMPEAASLALPALTRLTASADPTVCQAAGFAIDRISSEQRKTQANEISNNPGP
jgi:hypothetical protein